MPYKDPNKRLAHNRAYHNTNKADISDRKKQYWLSARGIDKRLRRMYGLTQEGYNTLFEKQNGCCAICGIKQLLLPKKLHVDHCHSTGQVRGLLCGKCNRGIGMFNDDTGLLEKSVTYLRGSKGG